MLNIDFTAAEIKALHDERFHHSHPRARLKMEVLWLKSQGLPCCILKHQCFGVFNKFSVFHVNNAIGNVQNSVVMRHH